MAKVRVQDDLYEYVNGEWIESAIIPDDKPTTGGFSTLNEEVEKIMMKEFDDFDKSNSFPNKYIKSAIDIYRVAKDYKRRNRNGIKPVLKDLKSVLKIVDLKYFNRNIVKLAIEGFPLPFDISVSPDMKNTSRHMLYLQGPSTFLPDASYYKEEMKEQKEQLLNLWKNFAFKIMEYSPLSKEEQDLFIEDAIKFDELIASRVKTSEEWSEYTKMYNPTSIRKVNRLIKPVNFKKLLNGVLGKVPETISVADPRFLKEFNGLFNENTFSLYVHWAYVRVLLYATKYLSEDLRELGGAFRRALMGVNVKPDVIKYSYNIASMTYSEPIGLYYGKKYFGEEAKKDVIEMVNEIINQYKVRIKNNDFLEKETKDKAIVKLSSITLKMGYPDEVDEVYDKFDIDEKDNLYTIMLKVDKVLRLENFAKINKPLNRKHWEMPGHMVNACYDPFVNDITFPAAILQPPFYSIKQTRSQNLGGIGAVIAHEISHAFDNNGAKCDENGNLNNWWSKKDEKSFNNKTKAMIKEFDGIELPFGKVNSKLIVSENIADNGGMAVTLDIMKGMKDKSYQEYFINWAKVWCMKAKKEYQALLLQIDVHAPTILRANMQPRNFAEWYEAFNVSKKDKMYLAPNKRVIIW